MVNWELNSVFHATCAYHMEDKYIYRTIVQFVFQFYENMLFEKIYLEKSKKVKNKELQFQINE